MCAEHVRQHSWRRLKKGSDDNSESSSTKWSSGQPGEKDLKDPVKVSSGDKYVTGDKGGSGYKGGDILLPEDKPDSKLSKKESKKESKKSEQESKTTPDSSNADGSEPAPPGETDDERAKRCKSRTNMCFLNFRPWMEKNNIHFENKKAGEQ